MAMVTVATPIGLSDSSMTTKLACVSSIWVASLRSARSMKISREPLAKVLRYFSSSPCQ